MLNGTYFHPTLFHFGTEMEIRAGAEIKKYASNVLFHYGEGSIKKNGLYARVIDSLTRAELNIFELGGVEPNPRSDLVYKGIDLCRKEKISFVLAVGGGSVIDSAKAIALGVPYKGDFFELFENKGRPESALKIGTILTIPGSGSESSSSSVITDLKTRSKNVCDHPLLFPVFSILNPIYTCSISKFHTSCGIVDAISHIFERYFSKTDYVDCTDRICEGLLQTLIKYGLLVNDDPYNYGIRSEIMWACKLAHDITPGFGRKQDWACHKIAHEISALYDLSHGAVIGVLFLSWMNWIADKNSLKLAQLGQRIFGIEESKPEEWANETIRHYREFLQKIGMPVTLCEVGISNKAKFSEIAKRAVRFMESGTVGNYVRLTPDDITVLLERAYE